MKLILESIKVSFFNNEILKDASFKFESGSIYALLGRNGVGKTTLFNALAKEINSTGRAFIEDKETKELGRDDIGYVSSTPLVPEFLTGREFLKFYCDINKEKITDKKSIDEYFDLVKIAEEDRDKLLKNYSHGMKSKMQLLISIIDDAKILLLDEPLTSLDIVASEEMKKILKSLKNNKIIIFSTHIMEFALSICDKIVLLQDGVLSSILKDDLNEDDTKNKIIASLKGE